MVTDLLSLETGGSPPHLVGSVPASPGPRHKFKPHGTYVQQNLSKIDVTKMLLAWVSAPKNPHVHYLALNRMANLRAWVFFSRVWAYPEPDPVLKLNPRPLPVQAGQVVETCHWFGRSESLKPHLNRLKHAFKYTFNTGGQSPIDRVW